MLEAFAIGVIGHIPSEVSFLLAVVVHQGQHFAAVIGSLAGKTIEVIRHRDVSTAAGEVFLSGLPGDTQGSSIFVHILGRTDPMAHVSPIPGKGYLIAHDKTGGVPVFSVGTHITGSQKIHKGHVITQAVLFLYVKGADKALWVITGMQNQAVKQRVIRPVEQTRGV